MSEIPMASDRDPSCSDAPWCPEATLLRRVTAGWWVVGFGLLTQVGCMSALTATTLREALRETAASLSTPHDLDHAALGPKSRRSSETDEEDPVEEEPTDEVDDVALEKVIDNAVARLSAAGGIDPATQELLIQTLEKTPPQDWAVVVNDFAATLEAAREAEGRTTPADDRRATPADDGQASTPRPASTGGLIMPATAPAPLDVTGIAATPIAAATPTQVVVPGVPVAETLPSTPPLVIEPSATPPAPPPPSAVPAVALVELETVPPPAAEPAAMPLPPEPEAFADQPPPARPSTPVDPAGTGPTITNPCFATRVRGWGQIDRFPGIAFRAGQEVIVYFELDRLRIRADDGGHTTTIDTAFRLLDGAGDKVGEWSFEPIVETCPSPRRDYFARYFIRIPEDARPGRHRLEWSVTDTLAGATRQAHLDLDVVPTE